MTKVLCIVRSSTVAQEIETQKKELIEFARTKGFNDSDMVFIEAQGAIVYHLERENVSERQEIALNQTEMEGSYLLNYHSIFI